MKITDYDGSKLRMILIGMITDSKVCARISSVMSKTNGPRFGTEYADIIAKWCMDHMHKYGTPPNGNIQTIFSEWASTTNRDNSTINNIEDLLEHLSEEHIRSAHENTDYILDLASSHFNKYKLEEMLEDVEDHIDSGQYDKAYKQVEQASRVELGYSSVIKPFQEDSIDVWFDALGESDSTLREPVFRYDGDLGDLTRGAFLKGELYAFLGIDKIGKSFYLLDAAWRALRRRKKVAYFEVGDLGRDDTIERLAQRVQKRPIEDEYVQWPTKILEDETVKFTRVRKDGISIHKALSIAKRITRGRELLQLSCHPNSTINVSGIDACLQDWAKEDMWIPDMIVIDYADILAPPSGSEFDSLVSIDETWRQLRKLSQKHNALVLTATQAGAVAYRKKTTILERGDFSGRKTKNAHVNGQLGINATPEDVRAGITRINWVVRRKGKSQSNKQVLVAGCLACASPVILSRYAIHNDLNPDSDNEE